MKIYSEIGRHCGCVATVLSLVLLVTAPAQAQQGGARGGSRSSTTRTYPSAGSIGDAYFSIDPETRRVVTIADEDTTSYISQVLSNLDRPKPQVLIKVVFLEVQHNNTSDIGIEGSFSKNAGGITTNLVANGGTNFSTIYNPAQRYMSGSTFYNFPTTGASGLYQILGQDYQITLHAIATAGKAKVLSRPSILARNNQPATITVGQSVPLITSVRYDSLGNAINSVTYQDVGVILKVTPFITPDGLVEMIVSPQISSIDQTLKIPISATVDAPVIDVRSADTVAVTPDGQTVIIGGLMQAAKAENDTKIPVLGDLPLLGNLFKRRQKSDSQTELMIFLTPHIVMAPSELASVSDAERKKVGAEKALTEEELNKFLDKLPNKEPKPSNGKKSSGPGGSW